MHCVLSNLENHVVTNELTNIDNSKKIVIVPLLTFVQENVCYEGFNLFSNNYYRDR